MHYGSQVNITVLSLEVICRAAYCFLLDEKKRKRWEVAGGRELISVRSPLGGSSVTKGTHISGCLEASCLFVSRLCLVQRFLFAMT